MTLRLEREGAVATLLIDRPRQHNAMNQAMWEQLPRLVQEAMADEAIRVLILSSATPGLFCAGADIHEFARCSGDEEDGKSTRLNSSHQCDYRMPYSV